MMIRVKPLGTLHRKFPNLGVDSRNSRDDDMMIRVKPLGTLHRKFPNLGVDREFSVDVPDGSMVKDLLVRLEISESMAAMNGRVIKADHPLKEGAVVTLFNPLFGG
ncbi:MAG: hypothetical protein GY859_21470 [Desulfobacterales bacterium]|nr:hypothetical protein [Desulfobacterales bacterium]